MKLIGAALGFVAMCAIGAGAQTSQTRKTEEKTKVKVDGREITISGCLERNPGGGYMLTDRSTGGMKYALVTDDDLSKHMGHRVEIKGEASDMGDAKVKIESKVDSKTEGTSGKTKEKAKAKTEAKGTLGLHYLKVESLKMVSTSCS